VKPFVLASDTSYVVVWPGGSVAVLGVAVSVKVVDAVIASVPKDTCPLAVTVTGPVVAPVGMTNDKLVPVALETDAGIVPPPCWLSVTCGVAPLAVKFVPVTEISAPTDAEVGVKLVIVGGGATVNATPLLATPDTVTTTFPVVAPLGTGTTMLVPDVLQLVGAPVVPLNVTVLVPWLAPKFVPVIVTEVPIPPDVGLRLVMLGVPPPPFPAAARKVTICMIHAHEGETGAVAPYAPVVVTTRSSRISASVLVITRLE